MVRITQKVRVANGKLNLSRKVIDLGTGDVIEELSQKDTKDLDPQHFKEKAEKGQCDYDIKMDKETWQYFKSYL